MKAIRGKLCQVYKNQKLKTAKEKLGSSVHSFAIKLSLKCLLKTNIYAKCDLFFSLTAVVCWYGIFEGLVPCIN